MGHTYVTYYYCYIKLNLRQTGVRSDSSGDNRTQKRFESTKVLSNNENMLQILSLIIRVSTVLLLISCQVLAAL